MASNQPMKDNGDRRRVVYLAGSVDSVTPKEANAWRDQATEFFVKHGYLTFSPNKPWGGVRLPLPKEQALAVDHICRVAIQECSIMFVNLSKIGIGTCREIEYAKLLRKRVVGFTGGTEIVNVFTHDLELSLTMNEALLSSIR